MKKDDQFVEILVTNSDDDGNVRTIGGKGTLEQALNQIYEKGENLDLCDDVLVSYRIDGADWINCYSLNAVIEAVAESKKAGSIWYK